MSFLSLNYLLWSMSPSKVALPLVTCGRQVCQILFHICLIPAAGLRFRLNLASGKSTLCFRISWYRALGKRGLCGLWTKGPSRTKKKADRVDEKRERERERERERDQRRKSCLFSLMCRISVCLTRQ
ncbi:hypothetical protein LZ31DRAFT_235530 [Colletotrichum somersetense]|nr:hypothetical protein LZ31DRAFT_235530 [Colletotrichum somersetense]